MNTNTVINNIDISREKILYFLKEIQKQLIGYNSIQVDDLKKIIAIIYQQETLTEKDLEIHNLIINICSNINQTTKIYNGTINYETNCAEIFLSLLNFKLVEGLN